MLMMNERLDAEKQVSVDPISMARATHRSWSTPVKPLPSLPTKYKFLSTTNSLPVSPRIPSSKIRPTTTTDHPQNPTPSPTNTTRLQRSKSGGENRSSVPYSSFDTSVAAIVCARTSSSCKTFTNPAAACTDGEDHATRTMANEEVIKPKSNADSEFRCGALCLFLPGFGKGKTVRAKRVEPEGARSAVISNRVSLEKFECGSWRSSAVHSDDDQHSSALYFDLPLELIRTSNVNDASLPMNSAFVFNKSAKGVLKTTGGGGGGGSAERKSQEGCRRVRFSTCDPPAQATSPSSCITPRLRKAREDFNAFLEAQSA